MELTFLGTAASEGYPHMVCGCANCRRARDLGGPSLRKRSSALLDGHLLIDLGPDLVAAAQTHGLALTELRYGLQTHEHADHLDPSHFGSRSRDCGVGELPRFQFFATQGALDRVASAYAGLPAGGLLDPAVGERWQLDAHVVGPCQRFAVGPYRVSSLPAAHDPRLVALLYVIERDGRTLFYGTDTGPLPDPAWAALRAWGLRFDVVALDHTMGLQEGEAAGHLTARQFRSQVARMREAGLLADGVRVYAHHFAHHSNPPHPELVALAAEHGYAVAHDGLTVTV